MLFRVHGSSVAETSWLACATVLGVVALPWNLARTARAVESVELMVPGSRLLFLFFDDAVLLCFACVETLCALELLHPSDVFYSSAVSADRSGKAASTFRASAAANVILLCFPSESRESHCNGCMKVANSALAAIVSFWHPLWRSGFGAAKSLQCVEPLCIILLRFATQCLRIAMELLRQGFWHLQLQA